MSIALDLLHDGFTARVDVFGQGNDEAWWLVHVATGAKFRGIIMPVQFLDPSMDLGGDLRELSTLQVDRTDAPAALMAGGAASSQTIHDGLDTWRTVRREDNPADFAVKFWIVKVTTQDK